MIIRVKKHHELSLQCNDLLELLLEVVYIDKKEPTNSLP